MLLRIAGFVFKTMDLNFDSIALVGVRIQR